ncbi:MAG: DUF917 family protein [Candidatus Latescibacteria bacterium]|nr:DUF917 family protein [Candidatus Latescibacterota bacterium]
MHTSETWLEDTVWGGALLGGGGGGSVTEGMVLGRTAFKVGRPSLVHPDNHPGEALIASCAVARAPLGRKYHIKPGDHVRSVEILREHLSGELTGLIPEGMGGRAVIDGWYQSAVLEIPVIDLPADGRGHPLDLQGSLGLTLQKDFISWQACAGGDPKRGEYVEMYTSASLPIADRLTRRAAAQAGGAVCVTRNPVPVARAVEGGVPGGTRKARELGKEYRGQLASGVESAAAWFADCMEGRYWGEVQVNDYRTSYSLGMEIVMVDCTPYRLQGMGTFLTIERDGELLAQFTDLIVALDALNGMPLTIEEMSKGRRILLLTIPARSLKLGSGCKDLELLQSLEELVGRSLTP